MGVIKITLDGSFGHDNTVISAMEHGHARAISDAIKFLNQKLPNAIRQDHDLHEAGQKPQKNFGRDM